jgi:hypothetical protein
METCRIWALLGLLATAAANADVWRWVDDSGVVHFSDTPVEGAEQVDVSASTRSTGSRLYNQRPDIPDDEPEEESAEEEAAGYESATISTPAAEETLWNIEGVLNASLQLSPPLQAGHQVRVYLDGSEQMTVRSTSFTIDGVYRGVHNIQAEVLNEAGKVMIRTQPNRFYVQQNTVRGITAR